MWEAVQDVKALCLESLQLALDLSNIWGVKALCLEYVQVTGTKLRGISKNMPSAGGVGHLEGGPLRLVDVEGLEGVAPGLVLEGAVVVVILGRHLPLLAAALVWFVHLHHLLRHPRPSD